QSHFIGEQPILITNNDQRKVLFSQIKKSLQHLPNVQDCYFTQKDNLNFVVYLTSERGYSDTFYIEINKKNELTIGIYRFESCIYDIKQITTFPQKIVDALNSVYLNDKKREKIRAIKHTAILAKIQEIAKEENIEYCAVEQKTKLKLMVLLRPGQRLEIDIPYATFQSTLKNIQKAIHSIIELRNEGLSFKIRGYVPGHDEPLWEKCE
ncbi:MAG: hypothetical protein HQK77_16715, partial [Desulfobacterales bacterium]|nr:hypothetical protein [Desulfobacterales bacterium]